MSSPNEIEKLRLTLHRIQEIVTDTRQAAEDRVEAIQLVCQETGGQDGFIAGATGSRSTPLDPERMDDGTPVTLVGPMYPGVPTEGWSIENDNEHRERTYRIKHTNGSTCYVPTNLVRPA